MGCFYNIDGKEYTEEELMNRVKTDPDFAKMLEEINGQEYEPTIQVGSYKKYIDFKEVQIQDLKNRRSKIISRKSKATNEKDKIKFAKIESLVNERINALEDEIHTLEKDATINALTDYANEDLNRLDMLVESPNEDDVIEARKMINFYKALGTFDVSKQHPIFNNEELYHDNGSLQFDVSQFQEWKEKAQELENRLNTQEEKILEQKVNERVEGLYENPLSYKDFTKAIKDTSWIDMMIMDISNGIFSENGILPQVMLDTLEREFEKEAVKATSFEEKLSILQPRVEEELKKLGYSFSKKGIFGITGVSYELFKQKYNDGFETGRMVHRYSQEFFDERSRNISMFNSKIKRLIKDKATADKIRAAHLEKQNWYRKNTLILDITLLEDFNGLIDDMKITPNSDYKQKLISILGEKGYQEQVENQKKLLEKYKLERVAYEEMLKESDTLTQDALKAFELENHPKYAIQGYYSNNINTLNNKFVFPNSKYAITIPRKYQATISFGQNNKVEFQENSKSTGFYDESFLKIENNDTLLEFYNLLQERQKEIQEDLPYELQKKLNVNSVPALKKTFMEMLIDSNDSILRKISKAFQEFWNRVKMGFGIKIQSDISHAQVDVITGKPNYKVNDSFISNNSERLRNLLKLEYIKLAQSQGVKSINKRSIFSASKLTPKTIQILTDHLGLPNSLSSLENLYGKNIPVGQILSKATLHRVAQENTFDLPKVFRYYSTMASEYTARNKALPLLTMMKNHYEKIKKVATNNIGNPLTNGKTEETRLDGARTNAIKQVNDWFNRVALGNYGSQEFGVSKENEKNEKNILTSIFSSMTSGKLLSKDDKIMKAKIDELLKNEEDETKRAELIKLRDSLGSRFALSAAIDNLLNFVRFTGLGYNLSSGLTNFLEGQSSNFIIAASGDYVTEKSYYRALSIMRGSWLKNASFGKIKLKGAMKASKLMERYRVIQDSSNELQKASTKSTFSKFQSLTPFELTRRVEYLNQAPLMIGMLMDITIKSNTGETSSVWDAMNEDGTLKPEFDTQENQEWVTADGENYRNYKQKLNKAIDTAHGNYSSLRGMMAKSGVIGKTLLMFKTWIGRALYNRFAITQDDIQAQAVGFKGRYYSHTLTSSILQGALVGFAGAGLVGTGIGVAAGAMYGKMYGVQTDMSVLKELAFNTKMLFRKALGIPVNSIMGKEVIKNYTNYNEFVNGEFTERDAKNMSSNMTDMALLLAYISLTLLAKAVFWDDEDETDDATRKAHNFFVNRFMQLSSQATMYINPGEAYEGIIGNIAFFRFSENVINTVSAFEDAMKDDDLITSGSHAGESKLFNQMQKTFLPGIARDVPSFGFEKSMERQYEESPYDSWFHGDEKVREKQRLQARTRRKLELQEIYSNLPEELRKKHINKILRREFNKRTWKPD